SGRGVPDGQVIAGRGEHARVGAEGPDRFRVAQVVPAEPLAGLGIPVTQKARLLDGVERAVFAEADEQHIAIGVLAWLAGMAAELEWHESRGGHACVTGT